MKKKENEKLKVVYSNKLNDYDLSFLSVQMKRILFSCFAMAHNNPGVPVYIDKTLLTMIAGSHFTDTEARELFQNFYDKIFNLTLESVRDKWQEKIHMFSSVVYKPETIELQIEVDKNAMKYIGRMIEGFTTFYAEEFCQIQSPMGQELYRQMKQWKSIGRTPDLDIEELKKFAGMSQNAKIDKFRERVDNSFRCFEENAMFKNIRYEYIKEKGSKKITAIRIAFDPQGQYRKDSTLMDEEINALKEKYGSKLVDEQLTRIAEHPEWNVTSEMLDKWCSEREERDKERKKTKKDGCDKYMEQNHELLERLLSHNL